MSDVLLIVGICYAFYLLFVVTMAAKGAWSTLTIFPKVLLVPAALLAVMLDITFNIILATVIFVDLPQEAVGAKIAKYYDEYLAVKNQLGYQTRAQREKIQ